MADTHLIYVGGNGHPPALASRTHGGQSYADRRGTYIGAINELGIGSPKLSARLGGKILTPYQLEGISRS